MSSYDLPPTDEERIAALESETIKSGLPIYDDPILKRHLGKIKEAGGLIRERKGKTKTYSYLQTLQMLQKFQNGGELRSLTEGSDEIPLRIDVESAVRNTSKEVINENGNIVASKIRRHDFTNDSDQEPKKKVLGISIPFGKGREGQARVSKHMHSDFVSYSDTGSMTDPESLQGYQQGDVLAGTKPILNFDRLVELRFSDKDYKHVEEVVFLTDRSSSELTESPPSMTMAQIRVYEGANRANQFLRKDAEINVNSQPRLSFASKDTLLD